MLNTEGRDAAKISPAEREAIADMLSDLFGAPDAPKLPAGVALRLDRLEAAAGPIGSDEQGNRRGLYRQQCVQCHGISGDGAGPNAAVLDPYPRDFRDGLFKYTSTARGAKPAREDLDRILRQGIPGTAMPSFGALPDREIDALIEYVEYLSIRGETELYLRQQVVDEDECSVDRGTVVEEGALPAFRSWAGAAALVVTPPPPPATDTPDRLAASIARGNELFHGKDAQCVKCHGAEGRGDGEQSLDLYDDWNKPKQGSTPEKTHELAERFRLPVQRLRPRNFTEGIFHGGQRPLDIYWRIHVGIKGTPMPAGGPAPGSAGALKPEEIWDLVNYVESLGGREISDL